MNYIIIDTLKYGIPYALLALGIFISFRILDIADMSTEGSFTLGGALTAVLLVFDVNPWLATIIGACGGFVVGMITGFLHTKLHISSLLSGIITMTAMFSFNMVIMGLAPRVNVVNGIISISKVDSGYASAVYLNGSNTSGERIQTIFNSFLSIFSKNNYNVIFVSIIVVTLVLFILYWFFGTEIGMNIRATGINHNMAKAQSINTSMMVILGLGISNALIAASGSLFVQVQGSASNTMGIGALVIGLASIIIGESIFGSKSFKNWLISVALGAVIYYFIIVMAIRLGLPSYYQKLLYAILILVVLVSPKIKKTHKINKKVLKTGE